MPATMGAYGGVKEKTTTMKFEGKKAIEFGKLKAIPKSTAELRLRIRDIDFTTEERTAEAIEVLASFFPDKKSEVKRFLTEEMEIFELNKLQAYLVGGEAAVEMIERNLETNLQRAIEQAGTTND